MGTQSGESGSAATAVASPSVGADAHADHESAASASHERRQTHEKEAVERTGTSGARKADARSLGQPASARVVGAAGQDESEDRGANHSCRARSEEATRRVAADDPSWCGPAHGTGLRVDHRNSGAI